MTKSDVQQAREEMNERIAQDPTAEEIGAFDLDAALDFEATGWKPEPGEKLIGTVFLVTRTDGGHPEFGGDGGDDGCYSMLSIVTDDGEPVNVHAFHTVLANAVRSQNPQPGDRIGIKFWGDKEGGGYGTYKNYTCIVVKPTSALAAGRQPAALPA